MAGSVVSTLLVAATIACTVTAAVLLVLSLTSDGVPTNASLFHGRSRPVPTILAVVVLVASPWIVHRLSHLDRRLLRAFYGTDETARLQARLQHVEEPAPTPSPPTPSVAGSSGTCTTAPSSG